MQKKQKKEAHTEKQSSAEPNPPASLAELSPSLDEISVEAFCLLECKRALLTIPNLPQGLRTSCNDSFDMAIDRLIDKQFRWVSIGNYLQREQSPPARRKRRVSFQGEVKVAEYLMDSPTNDIRNIHLEPDIDFTRRSNENHQMRVQEIRTELMEKSSGREIRWIFFEEWCERIAKERASMREMDIFVMKNVLSVLKRISHVPARFMDEIQKIVQSVVFIAFR